jgi:hypothetical protein
MFIRLSIFSDFAPARFRTYIRELRDVRNYLFAHIGSNEIEDRHVFRAIDTMMRILETFGQHSNLKQCFKK